MMTNNKQFSQTPPDKVNELFAKLLDTSDGAIKTREQLFSDLRAELELLASIQEEHLFPVLRKHKETRDLVPDPLNDNMQTRALLDELENTPKDSEEFARKIEDLRRVFQQHIRDDRKELLPVVLKVLSEQGPCGRREHRGRNRRSCRDEAGRGGGAPRCNEAQPEAA